MYHLMYVKLFSVVLNNLKSKQWCGQYEGSIHIHIIYQITDPKLTYLQALTAGVNKIGNSQ